MPGEFVPGIPNAAVLRNHPTAGMMTFEALDITFETVHFPVPSDSLTVMMGEGDDQLTIEPLDPSFSAALTVDGGGNADTVEIDTSLELGDGDLSVTRPGDHR